MKNTKGITGLMVIGLTMICISFLLAQDWPHYLGPNRNSTSSETGIYI